MRLPQRQKRKSLPQRKRSPKRRLLPRPRRRRKQNRKQNRKQSRRQRQSLRLKQKPRLSLRQPRQRHSQKQIQPTRSRLLLRQSLRETIVAKGLLSRIDREATAPKEPTESPAVILTEMQTTAQDSRATETVHIRAETIVATGTATEEAITETVSIITAKTQSLHRAHLHSRLSTFQTSRQTHPRLSMSRVRLYREASRSQSTLIQEEAM